MSCCSYLPISRVPFLIVVFLLSALLKVLVVLQDQCRDGKKAGEIAVGNIWKNAPFKSNCDNIWKLDEAIQKLIDEEFPDNTGSAKKDSYNECARKYGIEPQVQLLKKSLIET